MQNQQRIYIEFVEALLDCPNGQEEAVLVARPELINQELIMTMMAMAKYCMENNASDNIWIWLVDFAEGLAIKLGLEISNKKNKQLRFLTAVLQSIADVNNSLQITYSIMEKKIALIDDDISDVLKTCANDLMNTVNKSSQKAIAMNITQFGDLLQQFPLGSKAANIELSINCYMISLEVFVIEEESNTYAIILFSLANAYIARIKGNIADNIEQAIEYYIVALELMSKEKSFVTEMIQANLAIAYKNRIKGNKADNIEKSIDCALLISNTIDKDKYYDVWVRNQNTLGSAYRNRITGEKSDNLEQSIKHYKVALKEQQTENHQIDWSIIQGNLANAYRDRIKGDRANNSELAIKYYNLVLKKKSNKGCTLDLAIAQSNLANVYVERINGDRSENLEKAIKYYVLALNLINKEASPMDWARINGSTELAM
jgi:tetratricopeptide (TPR) repeat protein